MTTPSHDPVRHKTGGAATRNDAWAREAVISPETTRQAQMNKSSPSWPVGKASLRKKPRPGPKT